MIGITTRRAAPRRLVVLCAVCTLLLGGLLFYGAGFPSRLFATQVSRLEPRPTTIVPGIHMLGGLPLSAVYAIETSKGLVLIDSGLENDAGQVRSELAQLGLDWHEIRAVLITHVHADHSGGAAWLREATGAKIHAGEGDVDKLRTGQPRDAFFSIFNMPHDKPHATTIDVTLKGGEVLDFGDCRIRCMAAPGHTEGSICYLLERDDLRALFAGDVIMRLVGDANTANMMRKPLGTYSAYLPPRYGGNARESLESLVKLRAMPVPDLVFPGHPASDPQPQSPCLSQERWEAILDQGIDEMKTLLARYEADGTLFLDGAPRELLPDLFYLGDFHGMAVYGFFHSSRFYLVNAPGGPGLVEFVKTRLYDLGRTPVAPSTVFLTACAPDATAGLAELLETWNPRIAASPEGLPWLRKTCPTGSEIDSAVGPPHGDGEGPPITAIPLSGRGVAPAAYVLEWAGKTVLFSPRIPTKINVPATEALAADLAAGKAQGERYLDSLSKLRNTKPDLWLPAVPVEGQNACLYDNDWETTIEENEKVVKYQFSRIQSGKVP
jgi:metallo-beta-lactamase class B